MHHSAPAGGRNGNRVFLLALTLCVCVSIISEWYMLTSKLADLHHSHEALAEVRSKRSRCWIRRGTLRRWQR